MSQIAEDIARRLENSEYREFPADVIRLAKENNVVIISGLSDDIIDLSGVISDEVSPGSFRLSRDGLLEPLSQVLEQAIETTQTAWDNAEENALSSIRAWMAARDASIVVSGKFSDDGWVFSTAGAHQSFTILEDGEVHSRGLVIDLCELNA